MPRFAAVVLAAGQGTRMKSALPKVLHEAAGRPLLEHVLRAVAPLEPERVVVVVGHGAERVRRRFAGSPLTFVLQERQLGTGHALGQAGKALGGFDGSLLVLNGDGPLLRTETLRRALELQGDSSGMTMLTCEVRDPSGLGRIVRDSAGRVERVVEEKDASPAERAIAEINPGIYLFGNGVFELADELGNDNAAGEYYITDLVALHLRAGREVRALAVPDETEVLGVNDRHDLALVERVLRDRLRRRWLAAGVTMTAPETTFIDDAVELGRDVVLEPGVLLQGATRVGEGARVGAYSVIRDRRVEPGEVVPPHSVLLGG